VVCVVCVVCVARVEVIVWRQLGTVVHCGHPNAQPNRVAGEVAVALKHWVALLQIRGHARAAEALRAAQVFPSKDELLLDWRDALFILDLRHHDVNGVRGLHV
jgi:hypothetical protein